MQSTSSSATATPATHRVNVDSFSSNNHHSIHSAHLPSNPPKFATTPRPPTASTVTAPPSSTLPSFITPAEHQNIFKQRQAPLSKRPSLTNLLRRGSTAGETSGHSGPPAPASTPHHRRNPFHTRRKSTSSLAVQKGLGDSEDIGHRHGHGQPGSILTGPGPEFPEIGPAQVQGPGDGDGHTRHRLRKSTSLRKLSTHHDHDDHSRQTLGRPPLPADWASVTASATRISTNPTTLPVLATPLDATPPQTPSTPTQTQTVSLDLNTNMYGGVLIAPLPTGLGIMSSNLNPAHMGTPNEGSALHQHIHDMVNKRISTMDYLRKAHDGRVYWFNTLRFDRPDLARMPYFDARRLARRATNYMMLGLSLPAVVDLNSASATELLRSLAALMTEFEQFQQLHSESNYNGGGGPSASSLSRAARLPNMFRRATPGVKSRRTSSSAASGGSDIGMGMGMGAGVPALPTTNFDGLSGLAGGLPGGSGSGSVSGPSSAFPPSSSHGDRGLTSSGTGGSGNTSAISGPGDNLGASFGGSPLTLVNSESQGSLTGAGLNSSFSSAQGGSLPQQISSQIHQQLQQQTPLGAASTGAASTAFATYYDNNTDLLPGEEYTFLLTPSLPFDPDFYETFATLCDVLIDCYQRILSLLPSPRDCSPVIMELFSKADSRVRKLLVQSVVKEFEDHSRSGVKMEVANVGKIVIGGLM